MGCQKALDFPAAPTGAHLSFYWTMDEAGAADKVDSTVGLHWPLIWGATAAAGLFSNGTDMIPGVIINRHPGLLLAGTNAITINQLVSTGISAWFWIKVAVAGGGGFMFTMDTSDPFHTNRFRFGGGVGGVIEVNHTNDTDDVFADSPIITWNVGDWHMVAGTYNKTAQTLNLYIDSILSATIADAFIYPDLTQTDFFLENLAFLSTLDFVVDEFGLCLNGALTQAQITSLWNGGSGVTWPGVTAIVPYP